MKDNVFTLKKARSKRYPAETITDADYANDIALLANTPTQSEFIQHSFQQAAGSISLQVNSDKRELICFNHKGDISTLYGGSLKLVDKFTHFSSSVPSTESDIKMHLMKAWIVIDRLSIIQNSDPFDKIKRNFFLTAVLSILLYGCTAWTLTKRIKKVRRGLYMNTRNYIEQVLEATSHKTAAVRSPTSLL